MSAVDDVCCDPRSVVDGAREADADVAGAVPECRDRAVDTDDAAVEVDEGPAGVPWIDRCVGLRERLRRTLRGAVECADDPRCDGAVQPDTIRKNKALRWFEYEGERYDQQPHVKVRDAVKPNEVGRIHFALDKVGRRVIVNHVALKLYGI